MLNIWLKHKCCEFVIPLNFLSGKNEYSSQSIKANKSVTTFKHTCLLELT